VSTDRGFGKPPKKPSQALEWCSLDLGVWTWVARFRGPRYAPGMSAKPRSGGERLPFGMEDFWRWSASDLLSNALRGVLAEFIVARALGIDTTAAR